MADPTRRGHKVDLVNVALAGVAIETAMPSAQNQNGLFVYDTTAGVLYENVTNIGGSSGWVVLGGTGANGAGKYTVNKTAPPAALYTTVQSAINAAVADGHTDANPTVVLIYPGTYTETVTLKPGVHLFGYGGGESAGQVVIVGNVTASFAAAGHVTLTNLHITGLLRSGGAFRQDIALRDVTVTSAAGDAILWDNVVDTGTLEFTGRCVATCATPGDVPLRSTVQVGVRAWGAKFGATGADSALLLHSAAVGIFFNCEFNGAITSGGVTELWNCRTIPGAAQVTVPAACSLRIVGGSVSGSASPVYAGTGTLQIANDTEHPGTAGATTVTTLTVPGALVARSHLRATAAATPATYPANADSLLVTTGGGAFVVNLPAILSQVEGRELAIFSQSGAGVITATPAAGDQVNLAGAGTGFAMNAVLGRLVLRADRTTRNWNIVSAN